jgi:hypothetical protein
VTEAFVGIDVAFAKKKRLPVCFCVRNNQRLRVVPLNSRDLPKPPAGRGNRAAIDPKKVKRFALETFRYLRSLEESLGLAVRIIALDCPRRPKENDSTTRMADAAIRRCGISCFETPSKPGISAIRAKVTAFLQHGGAESKMPNANQLWMFVGFELFRVLEKHYKCREVFPQAIAARLGCASQHKSTPAGYTAQLAAAAKASGNSTEELARDLRTSSYGSRHDRLDAFFSAWIASLPASKLEACGKPPWDVIWIPRIEKPPNPSLGAVRRATDSA